MAKIGEGEWSFVLGSRKTTKKQIDMRSSAEALIDQIKELDTLIADNEARIAGLKSVTDGLRGARDRLIEASTQAELSAEERRALAAMKTEKLTTREMVYELLAARYPDGYVMADLWREIGDRWSPDIERATLSTTLIRMRDKEGVSFDGKKWLLTKAPSKKSKR